MFAGVTSIILNEEEQIISGISSKEGEEVTHLGPKLNRQVRLKFIYNPIHKPKGSCRRLALEAVVILYINENILLTI